jgi:hypothetical protein
MTRLRRRCVLLRSGSTSQFWPYRTASPPTVYALCSTGWYTGRTNSVMHTYVHAGTMMLSLPKTCVPMCLCACVCVPMCLCACACASVCLCLCVLGPPGPPWLISLSLSL